MKKIFFSKIFLDVENKVVVHRKAGNGKITNFNAVTFSVGQSEFKNSISWNCFKKFLDSLHYVFICCKNGFHMDWRYSLIGHDIENNPHQTPYGHWVALHCWILCNPVTGVQYCQYLGEELYKSKSQESKINKQPIHFYNWLLSPYCVSCLLLVVY